MVTANNTPKTEVYAKVSKETITVKSKHMQY